MRLIEGFGALGSGAIGHPQRFFAAVVEPDRDLFPLAINVNHFPFSNLEPLITNPINLLSELLVTSDGVVHNDSASLAQSLERVDTRTLSAVNDEVLGEVIHVLHSVQGCDDDDVG